MAKEDRIKAWTPTMRDRAQSWAQERLEAAGMSRYKGGSGSIVGAADFVPFVGGGMALEEGAGLLDEGGESMKAGNVGGGLLDGGPSQHDRFVWRRRGADVGECDSDGGHVSKRCCWPTRKGR